MNDRDPTGQVLETLERFHAEVDRLAGHLETRHADRLRCGKGCSDCCVDHLTVFDVEAERIRRAHPRLLREGRPHSEGRCALLDDDGACRVYDVRPYVCRTQGLPLRWIEPDPAGGILEYRDICPLNELTDQPLETIPHDGCWTLGPGEHELATIQRSWTGDGRRIRLRELFDEKR
jgi:hypothetical protein